MVTNPQFREELKKLKSIKYEQIKNYGCIAVKCPIDVLSMKERGKALYVMAVSMGKAKDEFDKINANQVIFKSNILKNIESVEESLHEKYSKEDVIQILRGIHAFDPISLEKNDT